MKPEADTKKPILRFLDFSLRLSSIPLSVASMWVMAKNNQTNDAYGKLEFSNLTGFKYLVCISAISAGYALVAAAFSYLRCFNTDWVFFILDQAVAYLMVTSGAAAAELLDLAHEGDRNVSWSQACDSYGRFCNRGNLSLALHLTSLLCFLALSLISAYRLFTKYDPPSVSSQEVGEQGLHAMN